MLTFLLRNAAGPFAQLLAGLLGQQFAAFGLGAAVAGSLLTRAVQLAQGATVTYADANDQNLVQGASGVVTSLIGFLKVSPTDALPVIAQAALLLSASAPAPTA